MRHLSTGPSLIAVLLLSVPPRANAQLQARTWVASTGNDAATCLRDAPCLTFSGAITKTAAGGEIDCIDSGDFGTLSITKSVTIDCTGKIGGIQATAGGVGIDIAAGGGDVIVLRGLDINGMGSGVSGVVFLSGGQLVIENSAVHGFQLHGVLVSGMSSGAAGNVVIRNTTVSFMKGLKGFGIRTGYGHTVVSNSVITETQIGLSAENAGVITADHNLLTYNRIAVQAGNGGTDQTGATVRLSNNDVYGNLTGFACGNGVLASTGDNRKGGNVGGTIPTCSPTVAITEQ
jgi:hypothetical protein